MLLNCGVGWHCRVNRHEFEQALGDGEDRETWHAAVHGGHKELDTTERLNGIVKCTCLE